MGRTYLQLAGAPPSVLKLQWYDWYQSLLTAIRRECPSPRATTYYFSQFGNDSTGDGSILTPYATIAKAQAIHDASNGNIALLFAYSEEWNEDTGLTISKDNVTVGAWNNGGDVLMRPKFNRFTIKYAGGGGGWTNVAGTTYSRAETNPIAWVRFTDYTRDDGGDNIIRPLSRQDSSAHVQSTADSWYWASNVLYVNVGVDPDTINFGLEACTTSVGNGITITGDGCRVEHMRCDGWGMTTSVNQAGGTQLYPIKANVTSGKRCYIYDCVGYYTGNHAISYYGGGGPGVAAGAACFDTCKTGYCQYSTDGETVFNSYNYDGLQETIWNNCTTTHGVLPSYQFTGKRGNTVYAHTTNSTKLSLTICYGHTTKGGTYSCGAPATYSTNSSPSTATIADAKTFIIGEVYENTNNNANIDTGLVAAQGLVRVNGKYYFTPPDLTAQAFSSSDLSSGWLLNCYFMVDLVNNTSQITALYNLTASTANVRFWNCHFDIIGRGAAGMFYGWMLDYDTLLDGASKSANAEAKNCIFSGRNFGATNAMHFGFYNGPKSTNNAFYQVAGKTNVNDGYDQTGNISELTSSIPLYVPRGADGLYQKGTDIGLEYDINMRPRQAIPSIGPVEGVSFNVNDGEYNKFVEVNSTTAVKYSK